MQLNHVKFNNFMFYYMFIIHPSIHILCVSIHLFIHMSIHLFISLSIHLYLLNIYFTGSNWITRWQQKETSGRQQERGQGDKETGKTSETRQEKENSKSIQHWGPWLYLKNANRHNIKLCFYTCSKIAVEAFVNLNFCVSRMYVVSLHKILL